jgi:hypothetical protein
VQKKKVERLISRTAFQLKGGGWYKDLYSSSTPSAGNGEAKSDSGKSGEQVGGEVRGEVGGQGGEQVQRRRRQGARRHQGHRRRSQEGKQEDRRVQQVGFPSRRGGWVISNKEERDESTTL